MMKLKLEGEYSHLKLQSICNIQCELDSFYIVFINFNSFNIF